MSYQIVYHESVMKKDIAKIDRPVKAAIKKAIEEKLTVDPIAFGKPLQYSLKGHRRLRIGDDRVIYEIFETELTVVILTIGHRREVYD